MRYSLTAISLSLCLIGLYFFKTPLARAQDKNLELCIHSQKEEIKKEENALQALKDRYASILKEKPKLIAAIETEKEKIRQFEEHKEKQKNLKKTKKEEQTEQLEKKRQILIRTWLDKLEQADAYSRKKF